MSTRSKSRKEKASNPRLPTGSQANAPPSFTRAERKAMIEEDANCILEELWGYEPEDAFYKIFKRDTKVGGIKIVLGSSKKEILDFSCRDDATNTPTPIHATHADAMNVKWLKLY